MRMSGLRYADESRTKRWMFNILNGTLQYEGRGGRDGGGGTGGEGRGGRDGGGGTGGEGRGGRDGGGGEVRLESAKAADSKPESLAT
jgi:hypothetical protein